MVLFPDDLMLDPLALFHMDNRFVVIRDLIRANDIVLALCETRRARGCRGESPGVFEVEIYRQFGLCGLLQEDFAEINHVAWVLC